MYADSLFDLGEELQHSGNPWPLLQSIAEGLNAGAYRPDPMPMIAYPKKGDRIRHYVTPTMRDQVAFHAVAALLGPIVDLSFKPYSFGNRLKRNVGKQRTEEARKFMPFTLAERDFYQPFDQSYGLFRRVAQRIVHAGVSESEVTMESLMEPFVEQDPRAVPYLGDAGWLESWRPTNNGQQEDGGAVYWARLDLKLAFPSVRRSQLLPDLVDCLKRLDWEQMNELDLHSNSAVGHPWIADSLDDLKARCISWASLVSSMVDEAVYEAWPGETEDEAWEETWGAPGQAPDPSTSSGRVWDELPGDASAIDLDTLGLPTGLYVSGWLLNVALSRTDAVMEDWLKSEPRPRVAYLRFADDIVILARSADEILEARRRLKGALKASGHRFELNDKKTKPKELPEDEAAARAYLERHALRVGQEKKFVTEVVRDLSGESDTGSSWLHGASSEENLEHLLFMAETDTEDDEVPEDSRLAFVLAGIANKPWPVIPRSNPPQVEDEVIERIRLAAWKAVERHPWRFRGWKHLVRIAMRSQELRKASSKLPSGSTWIGGVVEKLLKLTGPESLGVGKINPLPSWTGDVSLEAGVDDTPKGLEWLHKQVETTEPSLALKTRRASRLLRAAFHRSQFWRAYARELLRMDRLLHELQTPHSAEPIAPGVRRQVLAAFRDVEGLLIRIYRLQDEVHMPLDLREKEALLSALMASVTAAEVPLAAWPGIGAGTLQHPSSELVEHLAKLRSPKHERALKDLLASPGPIGAPALENAVRFGYSPAMKAPKESLADAYQVASLMRTGAWQLWDTSGLLHVPQIIGLPAEQTWRYAIGLDLYHQLREAMMSLHRQPTWAELGAPIFPDIHVETGEPGSVALRDIFYAIPGVYEVNEAQTPQIPWDRRSSTALVRSLAPLTERGEFVHPAAVYFENAEELRSWKEQRFLYPDQHVAFARPTGATCKPRANDVAPHVAFLIPLTSLAHDANKAATWQQAALEVWVRSGGEKALRFMTEILPWLPTPWQVRYLADECMIDEGTSWLDPLFGSWYKEVALWKFADEGPVEAENDELLLVDLFPNRKEAPIVDDLICAVVQATENAVMGPARRGSLEPDPTQLLELENEASQILEMLRTDGPSSKIVSSTATRPHLVMFPEWHFHERHIPALKQYVGSSGIAILAGLIPRFLPTVIKGHPSITAKAPRIVVNEGVLIIPDRTTQDSTRYRTTIFRMRKPQPSIIETALIEHLSKSGPACYMLHSRTWTRFRHPTWGAFSFAICSDLLNTAAWGSLRGRLQHFFLLSYNRAVDLFDKFSYTRGYEIYANVVVCNHGQAGGSVAWTPRRHEHKAELFRVHGANHRIVALVKLPAAALRNHQAKALRAAIDENLKDFDKADEPPTAPEWWHPPPAYNWRS